MLTSGSPVSEATQIAESQAASFDEIGTPKLKRSAPGASLCRLIGDTFCLYPGYYVDIGTQALQFAVSLDRALGAFSHRTIHGGAPTVRACEPSADPQAENHLADWDCHYLSWRFSWP
jgi:hypothetical protein